MNSLPIPDEVQRATKAVEMARIWVADGNQVVVLSPHTWSDPAAWGLMLADLARHVAAAYGRNGHDVAATLNRVREAFDAEWKHPTS